MSYKDHKWNHFDISYLKTFDQQVPVYEPSVYKEYRGEIFTTYHSSEHPASHIIPDSYNIHNRFSKSYRNVLRGLHYDNQTYKLVQALVGDIYLVVLDVRTGSDTYGKWESYIISESNRHQVLVPPGFANGHFALTDCVFHYTLFYPGEYVDENAQGVVRWYDRHYKIQWPTDNPILQWRDK